MKMGQFMKVLTSAGVALALSFLFYDQQDLSGESYRGQPAETVVFPPGPAGTVHDPYGGGVPQAERGFMKYGGAGIGGGRVY